MSVNTTSSTLKDTNASVSWISENSIYFELYNRIQTYKRERKETVARQSQKSTFLRLFGRQLGYGTRMPVY